MCKLCCDTSQRQRNNWKTNDVMMPKLAILWFAAQSDQKCRYCILGMGIWTACRRYVETPCTDLSAGCSIANRFPQTCYLFWWFISRTEKGREVWTGGDKIRYAPLLPSHLFSQKYFCSFLPLTDLPAWWIVASPPAHSLQWLPRQAYCTS